MAGYVALLYSIVLTPQRRVVMEELRAIAAGCGYDHPRTLASTGNLVFEAPEQDIAAIETRLEAGFRSHYGKHVDIIVRSAEGWRSTVAGNPFPAEAERDGSLVIARLMRAPLGEETLGKLERYLDGGERLALVGGDLWIAFAGAPSESRLAGALSTKRLGIGTARNWNTIRGLGQMLA
ncbi:DUF1697 domain-containing protein [Labrys sp. LIt4]|uniref:DUF1697 domain-containing protein n=1 Tax=Labrys sp. LIt4 TaxID=2821355 RepID=UPI001ADF89EA|nr:DUF1697 domain-containing protein [Labrys sp. LIt4]MBP0583129.1 DUF1697 domain-containing protein [Labrys sp. LIt4]